MWRKASIKTKGQEGPGGVCEKYVKSHVLRALALHANKLEFYAEGNEKPPGILK